MVVETDAVAQADRFLHNPQSAGTLFTFVTAQEYILAILGFLRETKEGTFEYCLN